MPRLAELYPIVVREYVCAYRLAETDIRQGGLLVSELAEAAQLEGVQVTPEGELFTYRRYFGERLAELKEHRSELPGLISRAEFNDPQRLPKSPLAQVVAINLTRPLTQIAVVYKDYEQLLKRAPSTVRGNPLTQNRRRRRPIITMSRLR